VLRSGRAVRADPQLPAYSSSSNPILDRLKGSYSVFALCGFFLVQQALDPIVFDLLTNDGSAIGARLSLD
jgi:hypothetical protein